MAKQQTHRSFGPLLAVIFIISAAYATIANQGRQQPSSTAHSLPTPKPSPSASPSSAPLAPLKTTSADIASPKPSPTGLGNGVVPGNSAPPVQALDIKVLSSQEKPTLPSKQAAAPATTIVAPTCEYLVSYVRTNNFCGELDRVLCWSPGMIDFTANRIRKIGEKDYFGAGNALASKGKFRQAISEYTKELKLDPDYPEALMRRAIAYTSVGDKTAAMADYCSVLRNYLSFDQSAQVLARIAELSGLRLQKDVTPPAATSDAARPALPLPATGDIRPQRRRNAIAPFTIKTTTGANYLVKLVNVANMNDQIWVFVRAGQSYETKVPLGTYSIRLALGSTWYGRDDLFGPETRFIRLRSKRGHDEKAYLTLAFRKEGNQIIGSMISLEGSVDGNLEQDAMTRADFDAN